LINGIGFYGCCFFYIHRVSASQSGSGAQILSGICFHYRKIGVLRDENSVRQRAGK
jgi:hypothetical protein